MIAPLLGRHLRQNGRLLGSLCAGLFGLELLLVWVMAQIDAGPGLQNLVQQAMPAPLQTLLNSQFASVTFAGAVAFGFRHPVTLVACSAFVILAGTIPAAEREAGLLDLVLSRPVERRSYLLAIFGLIAVGAVALPATLLAGVAVGLTQVDGPEAFPFSHYALAALGQVPLFLTFGGVTALLACGSPRRGPAAARMVGLLIVLFWVDALALLWAPLGNVRWLSPFYYFDPIGTAVFGAVPWSDWLVLTAAALTAGGLALRRFSRQDL
ncbi:MAG: ABC transporter permease [bacterium]|nr:ABC transporter permease [bacterium]